MLPAAARPLVTHSPSHPKALEPGSPRSRFPWMPPLGKSPTHRLVPGAGRRAPVRSTPPGVWGVGPGPTISGPSLRTRHPPALGPRRAQGGTRGTTTRRGLPGLSGGLHGPLRPSCGGPFLSDSRRGPSKALRYQSGVGVHLGPSVAVRRALRGSQSNTDDHGLRGKQGGSPLHWARERGGSPARPRP